MSSGNKTYQAVGCPFIHLYCILHEGNGQNESESGGADVWIKPAPHLARILDPYL